MILMQRVFQSSSWRAVKASKISNWIRKKLVCLLGRTRFELSSVYPIHSIFNWDNKDQSTCNKNVWMKRISEAA